MKFLQPIFISILAVFAPIKAVIHVTMFLILIDLVSGILAAKKRGEVITSSGIRRTIVKFFVYVSAIMCGFLLETYMIDSMFPVTKIISSVIGIAEGLSIFENLNTISGSNIFKKILEVLGSKNDQLQGEVKKEEVKEPPKS